MSGFIFASAKVPQTKDSRTLLLFYFLTVEGSYSPDYINFNSIFMWVAGPWIDLKGSHPSTPCELSEWQIYASSKSSCACPFAEQAVLWESWHFMCHNPIQGLASSPQEVVKAPDLLERPSRKPCSCLFSLIYNSFFGFWSLGISLAFL